MARTMMDRLTDVLNFQAQALSLRSERQRVIASNIANADTPGYQAREMDFAHALRAATGETAGAPALAATRAGHLQPTAGARAEAELLYAQPNQTSLDGNTVDMDRQRAAFADNSVKYEATVRFITHHVRQMLDAMKSHHQA
jgi:flagellar basal-body rod protein FlgB